MAADVPRRIQRLRTRGWRMPEGAVFVGRGSDWGNPFKLHPSVRTDPDSVATAVALFRDWATEDGRQSSVWLVRLRGHDLACWCPLDQPCHADVLLELANA